jgi:hypothetical protein
LIPHVCTAGDDVTWEIASVVFLDTLLFYIATLGEVKSQGLLEVNPEYLPQGYSNSTLTPAFDFMT